MIQKLRVGAIQPLGTTAEDGSVPLDKVPDELLSRFLNQEFTPTELEEMGVRSEGGHFVYTYGGCRYLLNFASTSGKR